MATDLKTAEELRVIYQDEVKAEEGDFTDFSEGSMHDVLAGAFSIALNEQIELVISEFTKTFFDTAQGPDENNGGDDDIERLAVDHYGDKFTRPAATKATTTVDFSRPTADAGDILVPAGSVVKTEKDETGIEQRFTVDSAFTLMGLSESGVQVTAVEAGSDSNVDIGKISVIETPLGDSSIVVTNPAKAAGGADEQTTPTYRETIRALIDSLAGATKAAIEGELLAKAEIGFVSPIEEILPVIEYDIGLEDIKAGATFFRIPYPTVYIADPNGSSSPSLIALAEEALEGVRACGVKAVVKGAVASSLDWDASITLNPSGPNFAELSSDPQNIIDSMTDYINKELEIGEGFVRSEAEKFIKEVWGPLGTDDITAFTTNTPSGDIAPVAGTKIIAGTISIT